MTFEHASYFTDTVHGQRVYRCCQCPYDTFDLNDAKAHVGRHPSIHIPDPELKLNRQGIRLAIGVVTSASDWPSRTITLASWEVTRLHDLGIQASLFWVDNGSDRKHVAGGTRFINKLWGSTVHSFRENLGQSVARNLIITQCIDKEIDYLLMLDGDIEIIEYSGFAMTNYLLQHKDDKVGCIGMYSRNCTSHQDDLATQCLYIAHTDNHPGMAWTQYGMFDCEMFRQGVKFDTSSVFKGQGWGFEDDELYCQMLALGYISRNTKYFRYAHYSRHSSLKAMDKDLAAKVWADRKAYVYGKWIGNPLTKAHVEHMTNQTMPMV